MNRREFLQKTSAIAGAAATIPGRLAATGNESPSWQRLPRWRGFNLLEKFTKRRDGNPPFQEDDFIMMAEWGFDFVRLPMSYLCWTDPQDWLKIRDEELRHIDQAVAFGEKHKIHVNLNFHRAPGYCVNPPAEPLSLWSEEKALEACAFHWRSFARRYKGIPSTRVSFDLLNEPSDISEESYVKVVRQLVDAIRAEDAHRLIIADGLKWGTVPVFGLTDLRVAQSTRGYEPMQISHYKASWIRGSDSWPEPTWPLKRADKTELDKAGLNRNLIATWKQLEQKSVGIHVGEWGAFNKTPHSVALAWMRDCLELWKKAGWGWALWNFRGAFGILDSQRADVSYEDFRGHKLDRRMLEVLLKG